MKWIIFNICFKLSLMNNQEELFNSFSHELKQELNSLFERYHFSQNEKLEIIKTYADLRMWKEELSIDFAKIDKCSTGQRAKVFMEELRSCLKTLRIKPDYSNFNPELGSLKKVKDIIKQPSPSTLLGKCPCPVDGEKTRCCKLTTLDAIMGCPFGCAYCSIASFYNSEAITVPNNLNERLDSLELDKSIWHIGTGQSSDSLVFADDFKTLTALGNFARKHPHLVIELKTKSCRTDFLNLNLPKNILFSWSINAQSIIEKEEHFTASLAQRIKAAKTISEQGYLVGFHIHPIVYFQGWEEEYKKVVSLITENFIPEQLCMVALGTLTFTKANLQRLRVEGKPTKVLELPLTLTAGKYSYPLSVKKEFFSKIYSYFPKEYKKEVFFYLCMEDPSLWLPVFGREYKNDQEFADDMKTKYLSKINKLL